MKNVTAAIVVLGTCGIFAAGFLAGQWYGQREAVGATSLHGRRILYYVDPMHPGYRSDTPGRAPDCGMTLEPVYADTSQPSEDATSAPGRDAGAVRVRPEKQELIGVRAVAVEKAAATERLRLYGRVTPDETRSYRIDIGIDGYIRDLSPVTTGSHVTRDQWLATFSAPELRQPIQAFIVALELLDRSKSAGEEPAQIDASNAALQQSIDRLLTFGVSRTQIEEISRTRLVPPNIRITAPADGFVLSRSVSIGQKFERGDELYRIADLSHVWILGDVFGPDAERVRPGTEGRVSVPGRSVSLRAQVSRNVLPQFDPVNQSVRLRLEAENPRYLLRPDMFVDVDLPVTFAPAIVVPADAILDSGLEKIVFVGRGSGVFEPRRVRTGWRLGERVEIVDGLSVGERVVVSGAFLLDSETRLKRTEPQVGPPR